MYTDVYNKAIFENYKQMVIGFGLIDVSSGNILRYYNHIH